MERPEAVSVLYLVWLPYGPALLENFLASYNKFESGYSHELVILFNGVVSKEETEPYLIILDNYGIQYTTLVYLGVIQDLDAYFWACSKINSSHILFLNSYSELCTDFWLHKYMKWVNIENTGIIGATGSWQSYYQSIYLCNTWKWDPGRTLKDNFRKYKLLVKSYVYWKMYFPEFPNPHIRTNAFLIGRGLMLSLSHQPLKNKFMAYRLESGVNSITSQVIRKGLKALVVDRYGNASNKEDWAGSNTFWIGNQENLLVSDNQTRTYQAAGKEERRKLTVMAWGKKFGNEV